MKRIRGRRIVTVMAAVLLGNVLGGALLCGSGQGAVRSPYAATGPAGDTRGDKALAEIPSENIRVLIMDTGFQSILHPSVTLRAQGPVTMLYAGGQQQLKRGEEITLAADDPRLHDGPAIFIPSSEKEEIAVPSVRRSMGTPSYAGTLEVKREDEGLTLINQLPLENYLTKVIPSEMPTYYEMEALKAQAVCARTYSRNRIQTNVYAAYGAHVDDSVEFQVYNNVNTDARAYQAVMETAGQLLTYNRIPVEGYFFSTSCGYTTDSSIWKNTGKTLTGYLKGIPVMEGAAPMDLTGNDQFTAFIKDKNYPSYDAFSPFYRWETTVSAAELLGKLPELGQITGIQVTERGMGGIAKVLKVEGAAGERMVRGQDEIRALLGSRDHIIKRKDNSTITGWASLPSAYIAIETAGADETGSPVFRIYGGGYGHGVGMSQNGAQGMAGAGKSYEEILKFFFTGVEVSGK